MRRCDTSKILPKQFEELENDHDYPRRANLMMLNIQKRRRPRAANSGSKAAANRRGVVTVEFAIIVPVFLVTAIGVFETSRLMEMQNHMLTAVREGARLAAMDRSEVVPSGMTTNDKVEADVLNYLAAAGLDPDDFQVDIFHHDTNTYFDLDNNANYLELFDLELSLNYNELNPMLLNDEDDPYYVTARITFRNSQATIVQ
jgi:Flp pilus assembly protein TadG